MAEKGDEDKAGAAAAGWLTALSMRMPPSGLPAAESSSMACSEAEITSAHVQPSLLRIKAVEKSQLYTKAEQRPSVDTHLATMAVGTIPATTNITLVDDVLTLGRTTLAAALLMEKARPDAQIRVFALVRTQGGWAADITEIRKPRRGALNHFLNDCKFNLERTLNIESIG
jgi:hypothetical protein